MEVSLKNQRIKTFFNNVFLYNESKQYDFILPESTNSINETEENKILNVSSKIEDNLNNIKIIYNSLINSDIIIRDFTLIAR